MEQKLLQQIKEWKDNGEYEKIISALNAIPADQRDYAASLNLAQAYTDAEQYPQAIRQLAQLAKEGQQDPHWHFLTGLCYYYLDEDGLAIQAFERALSLNPDYANAKELLKSAQKIFSCPVEIRPFRDRVQDFWEEFSKEEVHLRELMDDSANPQQAAEFAAKLLQKAFRRPCFQLAHNRVNGKYTLILTPEGLRHQMFPIEYWQQKAPKELLEHWDFLAGRPRIPNVTLQLDGAQLTGKDMQVWIEKQKYDQAGIKIFVPKLAFLLRKEKGKVYAMIYQMLLQSLGEKVAMRHIAYVDILERAEKTKPDLLVSELYQWMGENLCGGDFEKLEQADPCETYFGYEKKPQQNNISLRSDVVLGTTACLELVKDYHAGRGGIDSMYRKNGVVAGFLCYGHGKTPANQLVSTRTKLEQKLEEAAGDSVRIIGGATGLSRSYIDCICYDLQSFLDAAKEVFSQEETPMVLFHVFHQAASSVTVKESSLETSHN